jgi:predicted Ser/Thr protein kinase
MSDPESPDKGGKQVGFKDIGLDRDLDAFDSVEAGSAVRPLVLPEVIDGRYRVRGRLGAGAMGVVLRAEDLFLERPVAIKIVEPSLDPAVAQRFMKEARALAQLRHENIVQVYTFGPLDDHSHSAYLAMELVSGESLEHLIDEHTRQRTTVALPRAMGILRAIARGLDAVHARELVHRDVKPGNIIIEVGTDRPVLIDFGLARRKSRSSPKISIVGGTPSYMAPEQVKDPDGSHVTARTDLYAFACTAFELLTNRGVFEGEDIYSVLLAHVSSKPRPISTLRPELAPIDHVLLRGLAKNPADRYQSAGEMMAALEAGLDVDAASARASIVESVDDPDRRVRAAAETHAQPAANPRVGVLASDAGLRRSLTRNVTGTMRTHGREIVCDAIESAEQASALIMGERYALLVLDEESCDGCLADLVRLMRSEQPWAEIVIVSRDFPATAASLGDDARVRHLVPKPVNVHVLAAVIGRLELLKQA